mmetsp:Transcript_15175/g.35073  ORF Transcript_15175/g.35073 Transcript_15175/m.35073 type:complete len:767 (-) Transcript_15175:19-2319(-)
MARRCSLRDILRPEEARGQTSGTAKIFRPTTVMSSRLEIVEIHHRCHKPGDILRHGGIPALIDSSNLALAFKKKDSEHVTVEVNSSHHIGKVCSSDLFKFRTKRFPVVAFSTDDKSKSDEEKSWSLGVILALDPDMILICMASYNSSNELLIHGEEILKFSIENDPSVRYLNRINVDSCCSDDGCIQCNRFGPDRVSVEQLPPAAVSILLEVRGTVTPIVSIGDMFTIKGDRKRNIPSLDPTEQGKTGQPRLSRPHKVVNVKVGEKFGGRMHLVPYAHQPDPELVTFARVSPSDMPSIIERLLEGPAMVEFDKELAKTSKGDIKLLSIKIGKGVSTVSDPNKQEGHVEEDGSPDPDRRAGPTSSTWVPVTNGKQEEPTVEELDSMINIEKLTRVLEHAFGNCNAERKSVHHGGRVHYYDTSSVAQKPRPRIGPSAIPFAQLYREEYNPLFLPLVCDAILGLSEISITSARAVDPVFHDFLLQVFQESEGGEDVFVKNVCEVFTSLGLVTLDYYCTNHCDGNDKLGGTFNLSAAKANCRRSPTARKSSVRKASRNNFHREAYGMLGRQIKKCMTKIQQCEASKDYSGVARVTNTMRSINHIIRSGHSGPVTDKDNVSLPKFAVKASCGYLCRLSGEAERKNMRLLAYFAYTQTGVAVELDANRMVYNVFDSQLEHQTCLPLLTDGNRVYLNHVDLTILAWGCGKSARRIWYEENVSEDADGVFNLPNFIQHLVQNNAVQQAMAAGHLTQQELANWVAGGGNAANNNV